jgi:septum formation protein
VGEVLVLASRSPQRRAILERLGVPFEVVPTDVPELGEGEPLAVAAENARRKAAAGRALRPFALAVLGVDTLVALDGRIFGKPDDEAAAREMLATLAGATHRVVSGLALDYGGRVETLTTTTEVTFRPLDATWLDWYVSRREWEGRAGSYAIQGAGAALVLRVEGDYENVVGLPVTALLELWPTVLWGPVSPGGG